jgi:hypothetical protein
MVQAEGNSFAIAVVFQVSKTGFDLIVSNDRVCYTRALAGNEPAANPKTAFIREASCDFSEEVGLPLWLFSWSLVHSVR